MKKKKSITQLVGLVAMVGGLVKFVQGLFTLSPTIWGYGSYSCDIGIIILLLGFITYMIGGTK